MRIQGHRWKSCSDLLSQFFKSYLRWNIIIRVNSIPSVHSTGISLSFPVACGGRRSKEAQLHRAPQINPCVHFRMAGSSRIGLGAEDAEAGSPGRFRGRRAGRRRQGAEGTAAGSGGGGGRSPPGPASSANPASPGLQAMGFHREPQLQVPHFAARALEVVRIVPVPGGGNGRLRVSRAPLDSALVTEGE